MWGPTVSDFSDYNNKISIVQQPQREVKSEKIKFLQKFIETFINPYKFKILFLPSSNFYEMLSYTLSDQILPISFPCPCSMWRNSRISQVLFFGFSLLFVLRMEIEDPIYIRLSRLGFFKTVCCSNHGRHLFWRHSSLRNEFWPLSSAIVSGMGIGKD